eukprot:GHVL01004069.1.p1 GENE.GHVL01004069.1~~GHVL01004069.1.p1  ORF type:complete len:568 (+),score=67.95 GHVL01004069.1:271-1974(+)
MSITEKESETLSDSSNDFNSLRSVASLSNEKCSNFLCDPSCMGHSSPRTAVKLNTGNNSFCAIPSSRRLYEDYLNTNKQASQELSSPMWRIEAPINPDDPSSNIEGSPSKNEPTSEINSIGDKSDINRRSTDRSAILETNSDDTDAGYRQLLSELTKKYAAKIGGQHSAVNIKDRNIFHKQGLSTSNSISIIDSEDLTDNSSTRDVHETNHVRKNDTASFLLPAYKNEQPLGLCDSRVLTSCTSSKIGLLSSQTEDDRAVGLPLQPTVEEIEAQILSLKKRLEFLSCEESSCKSSNSKELTEYNTKNDPLNYGQYAATDKNIDEHTGWQKYPGFEKTCSADTSSSSAVQPQTQSYSSGENTSDTTNNSREELEILRAEYHSLKERLNRMPEEGEYDIEVTSEYTFRESTNMNDTIPKNQSRAFAGIQLQLESLKLPPTDIHRTNNHHSCIESDPFREQWQKSASKINNRNSGNYSTSSVPALNSHTMELSTKGVTRVRSPDFSSKNKSEYDDPVIHLKSILHSNLLHQQYTNTQRKACRDILHQSKSIRKRSNCGHPLALHDSIFTP